jgi:hypothetical protein
MIELGSIPSPSPVPRVDRDRLPTFMIIGAAKSGTTSLHYYLDQHPQISMSSPKETNFFQRSDYRAALGEYQRCFRNGHDARGEASHRYTCFPCVPHIPERISSVLPDLKLIYLVRDPVDRAEAHYNEQFAGGFTELTIEEAFTNLDQSMAPWICASKYATQIERYMEHFPRSNLMIVDASDLRFDRRKTIESLFSFLGVDPAFSSRRFDRELNLRFERKLSFTRRGRELRQSPIAEGARRKLPPTLRKPLFAVIARAFLRPASRQQRLSPEARLRVAECIRADIEQFREFTGRSFDHWSV